MSTTDPPEREFEPTEETVVGILEEADLCHIFARADADALAAASLLTSARSDLGGPFQVSFVRTREALTSRLAAIDETATPLVLGTETPDSLSVERSSLSKWAYTVTNELPTEPDQVVALAGIVATGSDPVEVAPSLLEAAPVEPVSGVAIPTSDIFDGLVHSTLFHGDFSGKPSRTRAVFNDVLTAPENTVASLLTLSIAGPNDANERGATALERAIRPYRTPGPFETLGGYADVLSTLVQRDPGLALALTLGGDVRDDALQMWRDQALSVHQTVRSAELTNRERVSIASVDGPVVQTARLLRDFRARKDVVLVVSENEAAIVGNATDVGTTIESAAETVGGSGFGRDTEGYARFSKRPTDEFVNAVVGDI